MTTTIDAPVNINQNPSKYTNCSERCSFSFNYANSSTIIKNKGTYLKFKYEQGSDMNVKYNNVNLGVQDVRLYIPSLNNYNGEETMGELIVHHVDLEGKGLNILVCVPISTSFAKSKANHYMNSIIDHIPSVNDQSTINHVFSLNDFIKHVPFYTLKTSLPYSPYNGEYTMIVMDKKKGGIVLSDANIKKLKKVMNIEASRTTPTNPNNDLVFYNKTGATNPDTTDSSTDDIWIDCNPTGDSLISYDQLTDQPDIPFTEKITKFFQEYRWILDVLISFSVLIVMYIIYRGLKKADVIAMGAIQSAEKDASAKSTSST